MCFKKQPLAFAYQLANKPQTGFSQINSHILHLLAAFYPAAFCPQAGTGSHGQDFSKRDCSWGYLHAISFLTPQKVNTLRMIFWACTRHNTQLRCPPCVFKGVAALLLLFAWVYSRPHFLGCPWISRTSW